MASDYEKAHAKYRELAKAAAKGDATAKEDKKEVMKDIRAIERESARAGTILSAIYKGEKIEVGTTQTRSKRSLQEEYIGKFDGERRVVIDGKEQTMQEYHRKRLFGK